MSRLCAALVLLVATSLLADPVLAVDRIHHAFGEIPPTATVATTFQLRNDGDGVLELLRLLPSCDCTSFVLGRKTLAAQERTTLEVVFDPRKEKGHVERSLLLVSNAPKAPRLELTYEAEVVHPVMASVEAVFFQGILPSEVLTREVRVRSHGPADLRLALLTPPPPFLKVALAGGGRQTIVTVTADGAKLPAKGASNGLLTFATGVPEVPELPLEYFCYAGHAVEAQPEALAFDPLAAGVAQRFEVTLTHTRNRPFQVLGITSVSAPFQAQALTSGSAAQQQIQVSLGTGVAPGSYRGTVVVAVQDPDQAVLELPVTAELH